MLWRIVRFLSRWENEAPERQYESSASYTEVKRRAYSVPSPKKVVMLKPMPPKSISGTQMLKLGKGYYTATATEYKMHRLTFYGDERTRVLSIVAMDYPYAVLQELFNCSAKAVAAAKVHCILFGRGGTPPAKFKFNRQCVSPDILNELSEFFHRERVSRPVCLAWWRFLFQGSKSTAQELQRCEQIHRSPSYNGASLWNDLPEELRTANS
ncbi:hypothetical protein ACROYT_G014141 [Oculina patagonica]